MTPLDLFVVPMMIAAGAIVSLCISAFFAVRALQGIARGDWLDRPLKTSPFGFSRPDVESLLKPTISAAPKASPLAVEAARMIDLSADDRYLYEIAGELENKPELVTILPLIETLRHHTEWTEGELWRNRQVLLDHRKKWGNDAGSRAVRMYDALIHTTGHAPTVWEALTRDVKEVI